MKETITEDFNTMRAMLSDIEIKLLGIDERRQFVFIGPLKNIIFAAWQDACNPKDSFLYPVDEKSE